MARKQKSGNGEATETVTDGTGPTTQGGSNITEVKKILAAGCKEISMLMDERTAINARIRATKEKMIKEGINRHAINNNVGYVRMEPDQRKGYDISYELLRESVGLPVQQGELALPAPEQADEPPSEVDAPAG